MRNLRNRRKCLLVCGMLGGAFLLVSLLIQPAFVHVVAPVVLLALFLWAAIFDRSTSVWPQGLFSRDPPPRTRRLADGTVVDIYLSRQGGD